MAKKKERRERTGEEILRDIEDGWPVRTRADIWRRRPTGLSDEETKKAVEAWERRRAEKIAERNRTRQRAYRRDHAENLRRGRRFAVILSRGWMPDLSRLLIDSLTEKQAKELVRILNKAIRTKAGKEG